MPTHNLHPGLADRRHAPNTPLAPGIVYHPSPSCVLARPIRTVPTSDVILMTRVRFMNCLNNSSCTMKTVNAVRGATSTGPLDQVSSIVLTGEIWTSSLFTVGIIRNANFAICHCRSVMATLYLSHPWRFPFSHFTSTSCTLYSGLSSPTITN